MLLGSDDFSKKMHIAELAKKHRAEVEFFGADGTRPELAGFFGQDLFARPKIVILENLLTGYGYSAGLVEKLSASKNIIIFQDTKLDKRLSGNKQWLADKNLEILTFDLPHGTELDNWIIKRVKELGGLIGPAAAGLLGFKLGRDDAKETRFGGKVVAVEEIYNLWQAQAEIQKLISYSSGREITEADVQALASENGEVDVFNLISAIAENRRRETMTLLGRFLAGQSTVDEKGSIIQLNALLSEQFRNVAMVQDFVARKTTDNEILEISGWKSGRLFVIKKIAARFAPDKVRDTLNKLAALDDELKTGSVPPKVLLDLILAQLFV